MSVLIRITCFRIVEDIGGLRVFRKKERKKEKSPLNKILSTKIHLHL